MCAGCAALGCSQHKGLRWGEGGCRAIRDARQASPQPASCLVAAAQPATCLVAAPQPASRVCVCLLHSLPHHSFTSQYPPITADFARIADFLHEVLEECKAVQLRSGKKLADFTRCAQGGMLRLPSHRCSQGLCCEAAPVHDQGPALLLLPVFIREHGCGADG